MKRAGLLLPKPLGFLIRAALWVIVVFFLCGFGLYVLAWLRWLIWHSG